MSKHPYQESRTGGPQHLPEPYPEFDDENLHSYLCPLLNPYNLTTVISKPTLWNDVKLA